MVRADAQMTGLQTPRSVPHGVCLRHGLEWCSRLLPELGQDAGDPDQHVEAVQEDQHRRVDGVVERVRQVLGPVEVEHDQAAEQRDADGRDGDVDGHAGDLRLDRDERHDDEDPQQDGDDLGEAGLGQVRADREADEAQDDRCGGDQDDGGDQVVAADLDDERTEQRTERGGDQAVVGQERRQPAGVQDDDRAEDHGDEHADDQRDDREDLRGKPAVQQDRSRAHDAVAREDAEHDHRVVRDGTRHHDVAGGRALTAALLEDLVARAGAREVAHGELHLSQVCPGVGQQTKQSRYDYTLCYPTNVKELNERNYTILDHFIQYTANNVNCCEVNYYR